MSTVGRSKSPGFDQMYQRFSIARFLLAIAIFCIAFSTLLSFTNSNNVMVWISSFAVAALVLLGQRRDLGRIICSSVGTLIGIFCGALIAPPAVDPPGYEPGFEIPYLVIGGLVGFGIFSGLSHSTTRDEAVGQQSVTALNSLHERGDHRTVI